MTETFRYGDVFKKNYKIFKYTQEDLDKAILKERENFCALLRQMHDSVSLQSLSTGFRKRDEQV